MQKDRQSGNRLHFARFGVGAYDYVRVVSVFGRWKVNRGGAETQRMRMKDSAFLCPCLAAGRSAVNFS
jgi:hypothetical protein